MRQRLNTIRRPFIVIAITGNSSSASDEHLHMDVGMVGGRSGVVVGVVVIQKATPRQKAWSRTAPGAPGGYQILRNHSPPI
jgi:hypothetical protein